MFAHNNVHVQCSHFRYGGLMACIHICMYHVLYSLKVNVTGANLLCKLAIVQLELYVIIARTMMERNEPNSVNR